MVLCGPSLQSFAVLCGPLQYLVIPEEIGCDETSNSSHMQFPCRTLLLSSVFALHLNVSIRSLGLEIRLGLGLRQTCQLTHLKRATPTVVRGSGAGAKIKGVPSSGKPCLSFASVSACTKYLSTCLMFTKIECRHSD